ncbi:putative protein phosphatase 2C 73 [Acorus calamus]|uniref:protein-serine/threonine phosphatase n=1 Tax=Acorus calamus TaxID=4465 RepID=A0AAV9EGL5_ACOCL|nr:putative protein phosphatase 2C 73 [Acorus calamus]
MGVCCSKDKPIYENFDKESLAEDDDARARAAEGGARVRLLGACAFASMFTQQGRKGVNQDAMTIWEGFAGDKDRILCGVFDGHGPLGHKVAGHVRDVLPVKVASELKRSESSDSHSDRDDTTEDTDYQEDAPSFDSWKDGFIKAFEGLDGDFGAGRAGFDCICSGTTAVIVVKQGEDLMVANLGDSRAILCTRDDKNRPVPVQLTVDLKPNLPREAERIESCRGRVFALDEEPGVHRLWLPEDDSPGLAMARAFGDFCLKDFGLIATPEVSHRKLTERDEFVVLATDGVWDVLSNREVAKIVASAGKKSDVARLLVERAVREWRCKHPTSKVDDCAVVCLDLKAMAHKEEPRLLGQVSLSESFKTARSEDSEAVAGVHDESKKDEWTALEGVSRVNSLLKLPRFGNVLSWRKRSVKEAEAEEEV